jgi:hypothetical protein
VELAVQESSCRIAMVAAKRRALPAEKQDCSGVGASGSSSVGWEGSMVRSLPKERVRG